MSCRAHTNKNNAFREYSNRLHLDILFLTDHIWISPNCNLLQCQEHELHLEITPRTPAKQKDVAEKLERFSYKAFSVQSGTRLLFLSDSAHVDF